MELKDARALITGGSKGIGRALAASLIGRGARVAVTARHADRLEATARELGALALPGDVSRQEDAERAVERTVEEFGGLDLLINNAAGTFYAPLAEMDPERFRRVLEVNVTGAMLMARAAVPHFIRQNSGNIVNISSTAGYRGYPSGSAYVASKFALRGLTECWRAELRPHNVRVMLVSPSEVQTNFGRAAEPTDLDPKKLTAQEIADAVVGALSVDDRGFIPEFSVWATNPF
jgi:3-oxoacyl-[acyl-carrier protein] reductase